MTEGMKWENGEPKRPLSGCEVRAAIEELLAQWVDAHPNHESGTPDAQNILYEIGEGLEERLSDLLNAAKQ